MEVETNCQQEPAQMQTQQQDGISIKVFETLEAIQACLVRNENRNLILFPRDRTEISGADAESLARSLEANTSLLTLTLEEVHLTSLSGIQRVAEALVKHSNLQRLTLYDNRLGDDGVVALMNAMMMMPSPNQQIPYSYAAPNSSISTRCFSLQALCLCGNQIGDRGAYWISQALTNNNNSNSSNCCVKELDLSSNKITDQGVVYLAEMMGRSNHLTTFILNGNQAGGKGASAIARAMQSNQRLDVLGLCGNDIRDEGAISISNIAKTHLSLKALLLEDNHIGERGLMAVADAHRNNSRLGMMGISRNCISTCAIQIVSASIENVIYLYLDHCEIGNVHMELLANGLRFNRSIKDLFLEGNQIGLEGTKSLARALTENESSSLEGVFLDGNRITRTGALILRDVLKTSNMRLKRLQIHDDYHDIQREMDVYLDMNGAGRKAVLQSSFPASLWSEFLVQKDGLCDTDMIYLFLKERPELFQRVATVVS